MGNAISEFLELDHQIDKTAGARSEYAKSILLRGALPGAAIGAGLGGLASEEGSRGKGAIAGAVGGGLIGSGGAALADVDTYRARKGLYDLVRKGKGSMNKATLEGVDAVDDLKRAVGEPYTAKEPLSREAAEQVSKRVAQADEALSGAARAAEEGEFAEQVLKGKTFVDPQGRTLRAPQFGDSGLGPGALEMGATGGLVGSAAAAPFWDWDGQGGQLPSKKPKEKSAAQLVKEAAVGREMIEQGTKAFTKSLSGGLGQLAAGAAMTAGAYGASKAIQAATSAINRGRGYKRMMEIHPDLADRDEQQVKGMYNLLHKASPTMAMNPYVAGGFIRRTEHASNYVDPKMVSDLAGAEANIQRSAWGGVSEPMRFATGMLPGVGFENLDKAPGKD